VKLEGIQDFMFSHLDIIIISQGEEAALLMETLGGESTLLKPANRAEGGGNQQFTGLLFGFQYHFHEIVFQYHFK
jgi:hypothetical protein